MSGGIPKGWILTPVSQICEQIRGVSYNKDDVLFEPKEGYIPLLRANNINGGIIFKDLQYVPKENVSSKQLLQIGDVVLAMSSGSKKVVGKTAPITVSWNGTFGAFCGVLRPVTTLDSDYFAFFFQTQEYRNKISELATGTNINNIKAVYFHKINFPLPPLNEQKRIVAKLDAIMPRIDSVKERLEKIPAILKRFRQSVLTAAVTGKLTEKWREEHPEVESAEHLLERIREEREVRYHNACEEAKKKGAPQPKKYREIIEQNNLIKDVDTWVWTYLANVAEISGGVTKGRMLQGNDVMRLPYLRVANVQDGYLDLSEMKEIEIKKQELARYALMNGDILFTEGGDRDKLGRGCVWRSEIDVCIHQNHIFKARVNEILIVPEYIALTTRSSFSKKYFDAVASQTVNLASINMTNLCALPLLLPPLEEQKEIVRQVDKLFALADKVEEHYQKARVRVDALAQSVLAKAFRGELVSQNPDDEPAEKLLQRIREEKAKMENELKPASRSARGTRRNGTKTQGARAEEKQAGEP